MAAGGGGLELAGVASPVVRDAILLGTQSGINSAANQDWSKPWEAISNTALGMGLGAAGGAATGWFMRALPKAIADEWYGADSMPKAQNDFIDIPPETPVPEKLLPELVKDWNGGYTEGAGDGLSGKIYTPVEYKGTVKVNGEIKDASRRVYQRNDIDINYFDETTGLTNLERMQAGKPPIGVDGNPIELHHVLQQEAGPMAELREITHKQYYSQLHGLVENGASFRNNPLLNKQYNNFRYNYWKWRANQITGGE